MLVHLEEFIPENKCWVSILNALEVHQFVLDDLYSLEKVTKPKAAAMVQDPDV